MEQLFFAQMANLQFSFTAFIYLTVFDAAGFFTSNIFEGRMIAHGSYDECLAIRVPNKEDPSKVGGLRHWLSVCKHKYYVR